MNFSIKLSRSKLAELSAEFLGTFFFMFVLFVSPLILRGNEPLVTCFLFIVLSITFGGLTKGHFNPVFSFADFMVELFTAVKEKDYKDVPAAAMKFAGYLGVQIVAGLFAFMLVNRMSNILMDFQLVAAGYAGQAEAKAQLVSTTQYGTVFDAKFTSLAFVLEFFFTMILVLAYQMTANSTERKSSMPFVVGLLYFILSVLSKDISGASFNPVRSLVPALNLGGQNMGNLWLYITAPLLGALVASMVYYIFSLLKVEAKKK
jgi:aquaporin Z